MNAKLATGLAVAAVCAGTAWLMVGSLPTGPSKPLPQDEASLPSKPPPPDVARLQSLAEQACLCRQRSQSADCDKSYNQAIAAYKVQSEDSACAPVCSSSDLIEYDGEEVWVTTGYHVVTRLPKGMNAELCRESDAQAVEAAYAKAFGPPIDWSKPISDKELQAKHEAANAALVKALEAINRGERPQ